MALTSSGEFGTVTVASLVFTFFSTTLSMSPLYPLATSKWQALWFVLSISLYYTSCCGSDSMLWITLSDCKQFLVKGAAPTKAHAALFFSGEKAVAHAS